ncbi:hypothetical protein L0337_40280 [candidate division KSB1 bacterium]|nr:hypothetical protein [candidate division KSB1 bacterium]
MKNTKQKVSKKTVKQKARRNGELEKSLPIAKIRELYKDEWLAVHLTKVDRYNNPIAGFVVAHSRSDEELMRQAEEYHSQNPKAKIYTFLAGNYIPDGVAVVLNISQ